MEYLEVKKDLFSDDILNEKEYYFAHCISADLALGAGIAVLFNKHFNMKNKLRDLYPNLLKSFVDNGVQGECILQDRVFNLVTKQRYYNKPSYNSIEVALLNMRDLINECNIKKIAMPMIGCGLDGLNWNRVSDIIKVIFKDDDISILICKK